MLSIVLISRVQLDIRHIFIFHQNQVWITKSVEYYIINSRSEWKRAFVRESPEKVKENIKSRWLTIPQRKDVDWWPSCEWDSNSICIGSEWPCLNACWSKHCVSVCQPSQQVIDKLMRSGFDIISIHMNPNAALRRTQCWFSSLRNLALHNGITFIR